MSTQRKHYWGHRSRLRARFVKGGFNGFSDHEIVELILTLSIPRVDVKERAKELLKRFGSLRGLLDAEPNEISGVEGIGDVSAVSLKIIRETAFLYLKQRAQSNQYLRNPEGILDFWKARLGSCKVEVFQVAYLDTSGLILHDGVETITEGTIDRAMVYPRRIIESAIKRGAAAIVLAHNHPNGDPTPSEQDKLITRAVVLAAEAVGISVIDHVVVTVNTVFSFRSEKLL